MARWRSSLCRSIEPGGCTVGVSTDRPDGPAGVPPGVLLVRREDTSPPLLLA